MHRYKARIPLMLFSRNYRQCLRLQEAQRGISNWKKGGPYLSERQWGTVRQDYSEGGDAWNYFTHDQARSRAYHWDEDGIAGISDENQILCFALALWNGKDQILKNACLDSRTARAIMARTFTIAEDNLRSQRTIQSA